MVWPGDSEVTLSNSKGMIFMLAVGVKELQASQACEQSWGPNTDYHFHLIWPLLLCLLSCTFWWEVENFKERNENFSA